MRLWLVIEVIIVIVIHYHHDMFGYFLVDCFYFANVVLLNPSSLTLNQDPDISQLFVFRTQPPLIGLFQLL